METILLHTSVSRYHFCDVYFVCPPIIHPTSLNNWMWCIIGHSKWSGRAFLTDGNIKVLVKRSVLPKNQFPTMLRSVLEEIGPNIESNLYAGLKKAGVVPIDENQITSYLPKQDKSKANADFSMMRNAFLERPQEKRGEYVTPHTT